MRAQTEIHCLTAVVKKLNKKIRETKTNQQKKQKKTAARVNDGSQPAASRRNDRIYFINGYDDVNRALATANSANERLPFGDHAYFAHAAPLKQHQYKLINEKTWKKNRAPCPMPHAYNVYVFK